MEGNEVFVTRLVFLVFGSCLIFFSCKSKKKTQEDQLEKSEFTNFVKTLLPNYCSFVMNDSIYSGTDDTLQFAEGRRYLDGGRDYAYRADLFRKFIPEDMKDKECKSNQTLTGVFISRVDLFANDAFTGQPACSFQSGEALEGAYKTWPLSDGRGTEFSGESITKKCGVAKAYGKIPVDVPNPSFLQLVKKN